MAIVTGDRYQEKLVKFVESEAGPLLDGTVVLKVNPTGLHYVQSRLEALRELEGLLAGAPVDYLRAYVSDLGDHRSLEQLRRILRLLPSLKVVSVLPPPSRDPMPLSLLPFGRLRVLELRGCDLSTSAARGLLELRHTLEKIICHNSTVSLCFWALCRNAFSVRNLCELIGFFLLLFLSNIEFNISLNLLSIMYIWNGNLCFLNSTFSLIHTVPFSIFTIECVAL